MSNFTIASRVVISAGSNTRPGGNGTTGDHICRDDNGRMYVLVYSTGTGLTGKWVVHYSDDNGTSWSAGEAVVTPSSQQNSQLGICIDDDNKCVVSVRDPGTSLQAWYRRDGDDITPAWTKCAGEVDWGNSALFTDTYRNFVQNRTNGEWWVFYRASTDTHTLKARKSTDNLATWGAAMDVATGAVGTLSVTNNVAVFCDSLGAVYVCLYSQWNSGTGDVARVYRWGGTSWARFDVNTGQSGTGGAGFSGSHFVLTVDEAYIIHCLCGSGGGVPTMRRLAMANPSAGWTSGVTITTGYVDRNPRMAVSADGVVHMLANNNGAAAIYRRSTDNGFIWSTTEEIDLTLDGIHDPYMIDRHGSLQYPDAGAAVVIIRTSTTLESYYIGTDDLDWPVIASGLKVTRLVVRSIGPAPRKILPLDLQAVLPNVLLHNWSDPVVLEANFDTDVTTASSTLAEERRSLTDRAIRVQKIRITGMKRRLTAKLLMNLARLAHQRVPVPLYCDESRTTEESSGTDLYCDVTLRRFFRGGRVIVFTVNDQLEPENVEYAIIDKIGDGQLILEDALLGTFPENSRVFPCMDAEIALVGNADMLTDAHGDATVEFREVYGWSALPSLVTLTPSEFPLIGGHPVLDIPPDWGGQIQSGIIRGGRRYQSGRGEIVSTRGARPQWKHALTFTALERATAWTLIRFFDSRRGRGRPFWLVSPTVLFDVVEFGADYIDVEAFGNVEDLIEFVPYVAVVEADGTITVHAITDVADNDDTFRITHDGDTFGMDVDTVKRVTSAHLCRMEGDGMTESWRTLEVADIQFTALDLIAEEDVEVAGFDE